MIAGVFISFRLLNIVLPYSNYLHSEVVFGGESFQALENGLTTAFQNFGGVPTTLVTDSLSAAYKNRSKQDKLDCTERFSQFCQHHQINMHRHNLHCPHEKGCVESTNHHIENFLINALMIRKSNNFATPSEFQAFVQQTVDQYNVRHQDKFKEEQQTLQPQPTQPYVL